MTRYFIITFIVLLMASTAMPLRAQEMTKAEMAGIRAAYSAAKERVELNSHAQEQNVPRSDMEIVSHYVIPGCGPTEEVIHYYFTLDEDPVLGTPYYKLYFISTTYNVAARKFYQEFLFGEDESDLLFFFQSNDAFEGDIAETRIYFGKHGVHKSVKGDATLDEDLCVKSAYELKNAFNLLMNSDY